MCLLFKSENIIEKNSLLCVLFRDLYFALLKTNVKSKKLSLSYNTVSEIFNE